MNRSKHAVLEPIIFIGMAGVGKTTIAKSIAKKTKSRFLDIDSVIMNHYNAPLDTIIRELGHDTFIATEAAFVRNHLKPNTILAPGGSFVYGLNTNTDIINQSIIIYLYDTPAAILKRIPNIETRGIVGLGPKSFEDIWAERHELYNKLAHIRFNVGEYGLSESINRIQFIIDLMRVPEDRADSHPSRKHL